MASGDRVDQIREVLDSFSSGNRDALLAQLTDDVVWHVGGDHPLSGDYRGRDAVARYHERVAELTGQSLRLETIDVLASERYVGIFVRATAEAAGRVLDADMVEAIRLDSDGKWTEFWALAADQSLVDDFWKAAVK